MYFDLKIIHVLIACLIFGVGITLAFYQYACTKTGNIALLKKVSTLSHNIAWFLITPAGFIQLLLGFSIIALKHYGYFTAWVIGTFSFYIIAGIFWFISLYYLSMSHTLLGEQAASAPLPPDYQRLAKKQWHFGTLAALAIIVMIFFMANRFPQ